MSPSTPESFDSWMGQIRRDADLSAAETPLQYAERLLAEVAEDLEHGFQSAAEANTVRAKLAIVLEMGATLPPETIARARSLKQDLEARYPSDAPDGGV